jgi:hypothetical protein
MASPDFSRATIVRPSAAIAQRFFKQHFNSKEALGEWCEATLAENPQHWRLVWTLRGNSVAKGLVDLYQRVIADPTNSGLSSPAHSGDSDTHCSWHIIGR